MNDCCKEIGSALVECGGRLESLLGIFILIFSQTPLQKFHIHHLFFFSFLSFRNTPDIPCEQQQQQISKTTRGVWHLGSTLVAPTSSRTQLHNPLHPHLLIIHDRLAYILLPHGSPHASLPRAGLAWHLPTRSLDVRYPAAFHRSSVQQLSSNSDNTQLDHLWYSVLLSAPTCAHHITQKLIRHIALFHFAGDNVRNLGLCEYFSLPQDIGRCELLPGD